MPGSNYDRDLSVKEGFVLKKFLVKWEMILVYIMVLINVLLAVIKPDLDQCRSGCFSACTWYGIHPSAG